jgi:predicted SnoaL-like aldol condensation-catalyzing enzyme
MENSKLVKEFIEQIWNNKNFGKIDTFLHPEFKDHSLPLQFASDKAGTIKWIKQTANSFIHKTNIEDQVTEGEKSIIKISMDLKHIGQWREIEATGTDIKTTGYRSFRITDGKIIEHWALINGESIENQINKAKNGCEVNA